MNGRKRAPRFAALAGTLATLCATNALADDRVKTESGVVECMAAASPGVRIFRGIPFAAPPVRALRWSAPQPVKPWKGVRKAAEFGPRCMQAPIYPDMIFRDRADRPMREDCLYLNVWTPAKSARDGLAVMVWFYGGGFQAGSSSEPRYDGENFAAKGIIVVSVNYRLETDRKSTRLNSSHSQISYAVFSLKKHTASRDSHLRCACQGHDQVPPGRARESAQHLRRPGAPGDRAAPRLAGRHRDRDHSGASVRARPSPGRAWPAQLLGLQHDRLLCTAQRVREQRPSRGAGQRVQVDGPHAARGWDRGHPRRRLQPHRGGQSSWSDPLLQGHRQPRVLQARARKPAVLLRHDGDWKQPQRRAPSHPAADHGFPPLLGNRDARRRFSVRPRGG